MSFRAFIMFFFIISTISIAEARKPAVEDFVGIDIEHPKEVPQGTEGLFNFEKDISRYQQAQKTSEAKASWQANSPGGSFMTILGIAFILGLPVLTWLLVMNHLRQQAQIESASNIEVLEKYRKARHDARQSDKEIKKAS